MSNWINAEDELPETSDAVLVHVEGNPYCEVATCDEDGNWIREDKYNTPLYIECWRPLSDELKRVLSGEIIVKEEK